MNPSKDGRVDMQRFTQYNFLSKSRCRSALPDECSPMSYCSLYLPLILLQFNAFYARLSAEFDQAVLVQRRLRLPAQVFCERQLVFFRGYTCLMFLILLLFEIL